MKENAEGCWVSRDWYGVMNNKDGGKGEKDRGEEEGKGRMRRGEGEG